MEPRKEELKQKPEQRLAAHKSRFHIEKLEERIAPRGPCRGSCSHYAPGHNK
jgi:hypothetical protein